MACRNENERVHTQTGHFGTKMTCLCTVTDSIRCAAWVMNEYCILRFYMIYCLKLSGMFYNRPGEAVRPYHDRKAAGKSKSAVFRFRQAVYPARGHDHKKDYAVL